MEVRGGGFEVPSIPMGKALQLMGLTSDDLTKNVGVYLSKIIAGLQETFYKGFRHLSLNFTLTLCGIRFLGPFSNRLCTFTDRVWLRNRRSSNYFPYKVNRQRRCVNFVQELHGMSQGDFSPLLSPPRTPAHNILQSGSRVSSDSSYCLACSWEWKESEPQECFYPFVPSPASDQGTSKQNQGSCLPSPGSCSSTSCCRGMSPSAS